MTKIRSALLLSALIAGLTGCASNKVQTGHTTHAPAMALASYQTYAWSSERTLNLRDPNRNTPVARGWIERAVEAEMTAKGLTKTSAGSADLLVGYAAASRTVPSYQEFSAAGELTGNKIDEAGGTGPLWEARKSVDTGFEQGRLFLNLTDRKTGNLVYQGSAAAGLLSNPSPSKSVPLVNAAVKGMLKGFPKR